MTRRTDFKQRLKLQFRKVGWDIHRYAPDDDPAVQLLRCLEHVNANLIFDVGANTGEFAETIRDVGFGGKIVSFEPLSQAHRALMRSADSDPDWLVHDRCAIGDEERQIDINVAANSVSSSLLPMLDAHSQAAPGSAYVGKERVPLVRLDDVVPAYLSRFTGARYVIKVDTQGFEWQVFDGGQDALKQASGVLCELSLAPLYEGQRFWIDIIDRLEDCGLTLWALLKGFTDQRTGRSMQVDGVFLRV